MSSTMATSTPFPLLNLPSVAVYEFLKLTGPYEQFQLSFVSKKTRNIVKQFARRLPTPFNLALEFSSSYSMAFRSKNSTEKLTMKLEKIKNSNSLNSHLCFDDVNVPVNYSPNNYGRHIVTTYWRDKREGVKHLLGHFLNVFNPNVSLDILCQNEHQVTEILSKLEDSRIDHFKFSSGNSSDDLYQQILEFPCKELVLYTKPSSNFRYRNLMVPMKFSKLRIHEAHWVKLDDFLHCKEVVLFDTNVETNEFNRFLKKWLQSDFQLEFLCVDMNFSNFALIFDGIPVTPLQEANAGYGHIHEFEDGHCFGIQRSNGEKAVVFFFRGSVTLKTEAYRCS